VSLLQDIPGATEKVIAYAVRVHDARQSSTAATVRQVIREADYLEPDQREALLGALAEALN
jgi:HD superfamily phosphohydrolase YqeK